MLRHASKRKNSSRRSAPGTEEYALLWQADVNEGLSRLWLRLLLCSSCPSELTRDLRAPSTSFNHRRLTVVARRTPLPWTLHGLSLSIYTAVHSLSTWACSPIFARPWNVTVCS